MKTYLHQKDEYSCSPIAIYNALVGFRASNIPSLKELSRKCGTDQGGTAIEDFEQVLGEFFVYEKEEGPSPQRVKDLLTYKYDSIIMSHAELDLESNDVHDSLLVGVFGDFVMGVNVDYKRDDLELLNEEEFKRLFRHTHFWPWPICYYLVELKENLKKKNVRDIEKMIIGGAI